MFGASCGATDFSSLLKTESLGDTASILTVAQKLVGGQEKPQFSGQLSTILEPLVGQGNPQAELLLGKALRDGLGGITKDSKRSFNLLERAGGQGRQESRGSIRIG